VLQKYIATPKKPENHYREETFRSLHAYEKSINKITLEIGQFFKLAQINYYT